MAGEPEGFAQRRAIPRAPRRFLIFFRGGGNVASASAFRIPRPEWRGHKFAVVKTSDTSLREKRGFDTRRFPMRAVSWSREDGVTRAPVFRGDTEDSRFGD